ncbi:MAG: hypothetical protein HYZ02_01810 [Candidatus Levybacteria bacterium]|nr:hypothetical protein [Candidatus Levybacteria bacterium]
MAPYFERGDGFFRPLAPGENITLGDGDGGSATFRVRGNPLFVDIGTVERTGPEFRVELKKDGVLPEGVNVYEVGRQGLTIEHEPTGGRREIVHVSYRS